MAVWFGRRGARGVRGVRQVICPGPRRTAPRPRAQRLGGLGGLGALGQLRRRDGGLRAVKRYYPMTGPADCPPAPPPAGTPGSSGGGAADTSFETRTMHQKTSIVKDVIRGGLAAVYCPERRHAKKSLEARGKAAPRPASRSDPRDRESPRQFSRGRPLPPPHLFLPDRAHAKTWCTRRSGGRASEREGE